MTEGAINKVLYDVDQRGDTTAAEKKTARDNIGAVSADESGILRRNDAELYFHHGGDGYAYHVRNIKNNAMNHVTVANHSSDICSLTVEAPTLGTGEEQNYYVVFDCYGSGGNCGVDVDDASPRLIKIDGGFVTDTTVGFSGSPTYMIHVIGGMWELCYF